MPKSRDQLRLQTLKDNPELKQSSELFREAFVFNAMQQERNNPRTLAKFLGMPKGEVIKHMQSISKRLRKAADEARIEAIKNYDPTEAAADNNQTSDGGSVQLDAPGATETNRVGYLEVEPA